MRILAAAGLMIVLVLTLLATPIDNGLHLLMDRGYFIPDRSSIFSFEPVRMNEGSGEWWLVGADRGSYYAMISEPDYALISRNDAASCAGFVLERPITWVRCPGLEIVGNADRSSLDY
jgi:hypothetical protein